MLISRNTCETWRAPSHLFALPPFPSWGSGGAWGPRERGPRLHSTAKKRSKGGSPALQEISTYTSLRVYVPRPGDTCTGPPTHTRLFCQVPRLPKNPGEERLQRGRDVVWRLETRVKPSSLIGSPGYGERKTPWLVPLGSTRLTPALLPRPMLVKGGNEFGARKERKPRGRSNTDSHRQGITGSAFWANKTSAECTFGYLRTRNQPSCGYARPVCRLNAW